MSQEEKKILQRMFRDLVIDEHPRALMPFLSAEKGDRLFRARFEARHQLIRMIQESEADHGRRATINLEGPYVDFVELRDEAIRKSQGSA